MTTSTLIIIAGLVGIAIGVVIASLVGGAYLVQLALDFWNSF